MVPVARRAAEWWPRGGSTVLESYGPVIEMKGLVKPTNVTV